MTTTPVRPVTFDVNVLVTAVAGGPHAFWAWPTPPPLLGNLAANCLGIVNDAREFSLWLSPHVVANVLRVLAALDWEEGQAIAYVRVLDEIVQRSGGQIIEPQVRVSDCNDYEDNRILELALASGAVLVVSDDADLLEMSPWRGIPVIRPAEFAGRVDAMRRAARRAGRD
jgi:predicted nucleic acid-binding protein